MKSEILNSTIQDIDEIFRLYNIATEYQKKKFSDNLWPKFERSLVEAEINERRQWKLVIDDTIACVWATAFSDPQIWEEKDKDPSVYIHRIATNPEFRGRNFVSEIVKWANTYAQQHNKSYIRLDTCGNNKKLINHYKKSGFDFLGISKIKSSEGLPSHYNNADVCYFQIELNS